MSAVLLLVDMVTSRCAGLRVGAELHSWSACSVRRSQIRRAHIGKRQLCRATDPEANGTTTLQAILPMCIIGSSTLLSPLVRLTMCSYMGPVCMMRPADGTPLANDR